ncbi:hypothetical protein FQR65_LT10257 [Abscondita terminalis]|nr:hypothetical protein FQR65_LT10257 [Abscondita terminalis]
MPIEFDDLILFPEIMDCPANLPIDNIQVNKEEENNNLKRETDIMKENNPLNMKLHDSGNIQDSIESDSEKSDRDYDEMQDDKTHNQENQAQYEVNYFIIVRYDKKYFPGKIIHEEDEEYEVSTMVQSEKGKVWKWPKLPNTVRYKRKDILTNITESKKVNSRGFFVIKELNKYYNIV